MASTLGSQIRTREGMDLRLPEKGVESEFTMDVEAVRRTDVAAFAEQLEQASEGYAKQLVGYVFETMNAVTQATGNVVDAGGASPSEDLTSRFSPCFGLQASMKLRGFTARKSSEKTSSRRKMANNGHFNPRPGTSISPSGATLSGSSMNFA